MKKYETPAINIAEFKQEQTIMVSAIKTTNDEQGALGTITLKS